MAGGANKKRHSAQAKENYKTYERTMRWKKNRLRDLNKHIESNPEDKAAKAAVKRVEAATAPRHSRKSKGTICKVEPFYAIMTGDFRNPSLREQLGSLKHKILR